MVIPISTGGGLTVAQGWLDTRPAADGTQGLFKLTTGSHLSTADIDLGVTYADISSTWVLIEDKSGVGFFIREGKLTSLTLPRIVSIDSWPAAGHDLSGAQTFTRSDNTRWADLDQAGAGANWMLGWIFEGAVTCTKVLAMIGAIQFACTGSPSMIISNGAATDANTVTGYGFQWSPTNNRLRSDEWPGPAAQFTESDLDVALGDELHNKAAFAFFVDGDNNIQEHFVKMSEGGDGWALIESIRATDPTVVQFTRLYIRGTTANNTELNLFAPLLVFGEDL